MLVTKLFRVTSVRILNKSNVTMSQKSLLSFFQKKTSDDLTRSPLQENTATEKTQKSPLKALKSPSKVPKSTAKATLSPAKVPKSPSKITDAEKRSENEKSSTETTEELKDESLKDNVGKKRSKKEKSSAKTPKKLKNESSSDTVAKKRSKKEKSPSETPKSQETEGESLNDTVGKKRSKKEKSSETSKETEGENLNDTVGKKRSKEEKSPSETPKETKIKSSKKRKLSEEREAVQKVDEKDTDELVPQKTEPEKMDTTETENASENVNKPEPSTPVLRTLSYLSSKKSTKKTKSKTPAKKKSNASPKETNAAKKLKIDEEKQSSDTDQPKDTQADVDTDEKGNESNKLAATNEKPKVAAFLNTKKEDNSEAVSYNPSKERYNPIEDACWKQGQRAPYLALAKTLQKIEETSARLKIISILSNYFRSVIALNNEDLLPSIYLCLNQLGPAYEAQELGIADTYLMKAIAQCTGRSLAQIKADAAESGDLGIVAEQSRSNQRIMFRPSPLTVRSVFNQLTEIAIISGHSAINKKIDKIQGLFVSCRDCEARFVVRSLAGKLRIGLAEQSVIQALALACTTTPPCKEFPPKVLDASKKISSDEFKKRADEELLILKSTYSECPNYNLIVPVLLDKGLRALPEHCKITPGIPVKPMLAQPTKGVQEVLQRFEGMRFTCEYKYDGERAQIHVLEDGSIKLYSRNMEDNTSKYPDIIADIRQFIKPEVKSCILDAEAVAWDQEQQKIMPFQILSTRKRKSADINEIKVHVCVFLFDLLYLNGESFIQKPLIDRRNALIANFNTLENKFAFVKSVDTNTMEEVEVFLEESVKGNCEGLMIKTLDVEATYEIAKRSRNWLKLKKDYLDGCGDTLDLVVIGGYTGKGKRTGQYGGFLLASYDEDNEEYQTICKIGTGFTEEALAKHTESLKQLVIPKAKSYYRFDPAHEPDFWFDAVQVWEVKCADLSLSPVYYSGIGLVDPEKGISLRFPRFLKVREDKSAEQATSSSQVADLYRNQDQIKNQAGTAEKFNEEDF